jgi:hypothetical protein
VRISSFFGVGGAAEAGDGPKIVLVSGMYVYVLTRPCIWSLSRGLTLVRSDIVRLLVFGRRKEDGAAKGSSWPCPAKVPIDCCGVAAVELNILASGGTTVVVVTGSGGEEAAAIAVSVVLAGAVSTIAGSAVLLGFVAVSAGARASFIIASTVEPAAASGKRRGLRGFFDLFGGTRAKLD